MLNIEIWARRGKKEKQQYKEGVFVSQEELLLPAQI
jgi:hypothetical protein